MPSARISAAAPRSSQVETSTVTAAPETEAYTFSEHAAVTALVNKLSAKTKTVPAKPDSSVSASDTRSEPAGRSVEDLRARLAIIKNYL